MPFTLPLGAGAPDFCFPATDGNVTHSPILPAPRAGSVFHLQSLPVCHRIECGHASNRRKIQKPGRCLCRHQLQSVLVHAEDSFKLMILRMKRGAFPWTYLRDESQATALAYGALRTPHFFVFDAQRKLVYTGRGVDNPIDAAKMTVNDLDNALSELVAGKPITTPLTDPIGCNVKWEGEEEHWMPADACDLII